MGMDLLDRDLAEGPHLDAVESGPRGLEERGSGLRQSGPEDPHHLALELLLGGPLVGDGEGGSDVGGPGTGQPAHRHLLEEQRHDERDHGHRDRRREHDLERVGVRRDDGRRAERGGRACTAAGLVTWVGSAPVAATALARFGASWLA